MKDATQTLDFRCFLTPCGDRGLFHFSSPQGQITDLPGTLLSSQPRAFMLQLFLWPLLSGFAVCCTLADTLLYARPYANTISLMKELTPCAPPEALPPFWHSLCTPQAGGVIFPKAQLGRKGPALPTCPHVPSSPSPFCSSCKCQETGSKEKTGTCS